MGGGLPGEAELAMKMESQGWVGAVGLLFQDVDTVCSFSFTLEPIPEAGSVVVPSTEYS